MKTKYMHKIQIGAVTFITALTCIACSDTWDDHYSNQTSNNGSLWSAITSNSDLSNFAKVAEGCGYDRKLSSDQVFTVFAPINSSLTSTVADSLIAEYKTEKQSGIKDEYNEVITQFFENHVSLYNTSVSSLTNDTVVMMNGKYELLTQNTFGSSKLLSKNALYNNGILYTIDKMESYFPNVWEYLKKNSDLDSLSNFLYSFNKYEFDASKSVVGGIVDGKTVYLDSVTEFSNRILDNYGYVDREDSNYVMIMPTNTLWKSLYDEYIQYFNYDNKTTKRDSMVYNTTKLAIINDIFYNLNDQAKDFNLANKTADSIVSTAYSKYRYEYHKFLNPFDESTGILKGLNKFVECSNGWAAVTDKWRIDKKLSFFMPIKIECERSAYQDTVLNANIPLPIRSIDATNSYYGKISNNEYVEVAPMNSSVIPYITYNIPNLLSNIGYDIYCVFVPAIVYNSKALDADRYPCKVRFTLGYTKQNGTAGTTTFKNGSSTDFITTPDVIDTVLVASNTTVPTCSYGLDEPTVTLKVQSTVTSTQTGKYTRTMRLDCIILKPHEETASSAKSIRITK
jgi:hypothetical protein